MRNTRRAYLKLVGGTAAGSALLGSAVTGSAYSPEPSAGWEPADPSNYTAANRENDYDVRWIVVHVTEGSYEGAISWFQNPDADASSEYVLRNSDGEITQMVETENYAWHAGNAGYNRRSVGLEHEGYVGETTFTDDLYRSSARIVRRLADEFDVPLYRPEGIAPCDSTAGYGGIIGHDQVPNPNDCSRGGGASGHTDPGSTWDWDRYLSFVQGTTLGARFEAGEDVVVTVDVNVRSEPRIADNVVTAQPAGTVGTVRDGYETADGYTWWEIAYDDGTTGWAVDRYHASNAI
ncbi:peptidoglycan recognition protein family protein [Halegenticoccus tardaugens]|uniref:peptidoglycan recognition protein family protein n=1 Tax=Halegenticoccus tardaugens TaxID=2071624 RepID=UPI00100BDCF2|nr:N-acetylmuramoyl-L-alanine amidase [Halegenticoccus tardaugens]